MSATSDKVRNFGRVIVGSAVVVAVVVVFFMNLRWVRSVFAGPQPISAEELANLENLSSLRNPWVTVKGEGLQDAEITKMTRFLWETRTAQIILVKVKDRWLLTEAPESRSGVEFTGYLTPIKSDNQGRDMERINEKLGSNKDKLLPFQMDAESDQKKQCYIILAILGGLGLLGLLSAGAAGFQLMSASEPPSEKPRKGTARADEDATEHLPKKRPTA